MFSPDKNDQISATRTIKIGVDTFEYEIGDYFEGRDRAWVTLTVNNNPPVAETDSASVYSGESVTVDVTSNDWDPDGGSIHFCPRPAARYAYR